MRTVQEIHESQDGMIEGSQEWWSALETALLAIRDLAAIMGTVLTTALASLALFFVAAMLARVLFLFLPPGLSHRPG